LAFKQFPAFYAVAFMVLGTLGPGKNADENLFDSDIFTEEL